MTLHSACVESNDAPSPGVSRHDAPLRNNAFTSTTVVPLLVWCGAICLWFFNLRNPLWIDETGSYWQIAGGFREIWPRGQSTIPAYPYFLWAFTKLLGTSEIALKIPSLLSMFAAVYVLYLCAREFMDRESSLIACVLFSLHPIVTFAAADARPYAVSVLVTNCAILFLLRWMRTDSTRYAVAFGISCGLIIYFHYLFGPILIAFALLMLSVKWREWRSFAPQAALAFGFFVVMMLPVLSRAASMARTRHAHVSTPAPHVLDFIWTIAPGYLILLLIAAALLGAAGFAKPKPVSSIGWRTVLLLGIGPLAILYAVSAFSDVHVFIARYRMVAVPGIALAWGYVTSRMDSKGFRLLLWLVLAGSIIRFAIWWEPEYEFTWKYVVESVNRSTATDHAPLIVASGFVEANHEPMPADPVSSPRP